MIFSTPPSLISRETWQPSWDPLETNDFLSYGDRGGIWTAQSTPGLQCGPGFGGEFAEWERKNPGCWRVGKTLKSVKDTSKMMNVNFWTVYIYIYTLSSFTAMCVFFGRDVVYFGLLFDNVTKSHHFEQQFFWDLIVCFGSALRISLDPTKKAGLILFFAGFFWDLQTLSGWLCNWSSG